MTDCAVYDIDGTLCEPAKGFVRGVGESWEAKIIASPPKVIPAMRSFVKTTAAGGLRTVYATARREEIREPTLQYLATNGFPMAFGLYMRTVGGAPEVVKRRYLAEMRKCGWNPVIWVDDDAAVIAMLRMEGVNALHCGA